MKLLSVRNLGEQGLRKVRREFDWETKVDGMLDIYRVAMQHLTPVKHRAALRKKD